MGTGFLIVEMVWDIVVVMSMNMMFRLGRVYRVVLRHLVGDDHMQDWDEDERPQNRIGLVWEPIFVTPIQFFF